MKLSRRSLLGALAALPLWGLASKGLVEEEAAPPFHEITWEGLLQNLAYIQTNPSPTHWMEREAMTWK